jgi:hypothetical protein
MKDVYLDSYSTTDLYFAAALLAVGEKASEVAKEGNSITFYFENHPTCSRLYTEWFQNQLKVDAYTYAQEIKKLKSIIHEVNKSYAER